MKPKIERMTRSYGDGQMTRRHFVLGLGAVAVATPRLIAQAPARPTIKARTLNHIAMRVSDVQRTSEWYQRFFGMPVQLRDDGAAGKTALLRVGPGPECLALYSANGAKPGFMRLGFGVENFERASIDQALAAHGVKGEWSMRKAAGGDVEELVIRDPDDLVIQLQDVRYSGGGGKLGDMWLQAWTPAPQTTKPRIAARCINHATFGSASKERAENFYLNLFGLPMLSWDYRPGAPSKILGLAPGSPRQFIAPGQGRTVGVSHYCLGVQGFNRDRLAQVLTEQGLTSPPAGNDRPGCCGSKIVYSGSETLFVRDPDDFNVQLTDMDYCAGTGPIGVVCIP